jgi:hypothetical protein
VIVCGIQKTAISNQKTFSNIRYPGFNRYKKLETTPNFLIIIFSNHGKLDDDLDYGPYLRVLPIMALFLKYFWRLPISWRTWFAQFQKAFRQRPFLSSHLTVIKDY